MPAAALGAITARTAQPRPFAGFKEVNLPSNGCIGVRSVAEARQLRDQHKRRCAKEPSTLGIPDDPPRVNPCERCIRARQAGSASIRRRAPQRPASVARLCRKRSSPVLKA